MVFEDSRYAKGERIPTLWCVQAVLLDHRELLVSTTLMTLRRVVD